MHFGFELLVSLFVLAEVALALLGLATLFFGIATSVMLPVYSLLLFLLQRFHFGPIYDLPEHLKWMIGIAIKLLLTGLASVALAYAIGYLNHL